jgi:flagellar basal body-associated protein FliL
MNLTILIILCVAITAALIIIPLIVSYKAEKSEKESEWDKIANYGNKINKKSRNKKLH